ncbi:Allantoicase [Phytophthora fragariae]|uniref:Allantoicase n=1 Tax=Phytophthora fragariae TaxID=53985 RepID=A0A6A3SID8_9STRA|nr:Allantoicase [Phytophthora fragariae]KAE8940137.1 Allantoicase [Phytophthora fragariae]KAE9028119.1 Allantoicase [Phytophthora fragariae]KAE9117759.1 Allantoicase [Phytophthora fragariae]KAE9135451.1 Allantoicase [Phytophthora fragariae]
MTPPTPAEVETLTDLASAAYGSRVLFATDEWFAPASDLLRPEPPIFIADKFTSFGKWMDGWESRRKRIPGHDWCVLVLGLRGTVDVVDVDTAFFTGNNAPRVSVQAADLSQESDALRILTARATEHRAMGVCASAEELKLAEQLQSHQWTEIVPPTTLGAGYPETRHNLLRVPPSKRGPWTHLRVNMFPDGGIARLRAYGQVVVDWSRVSSSQLLDLVSVAHGGKVVGFNDAHYGHPRNLMAPGRSKTMADGWETARKATRPAILKNDPKTGLLQVPGKDWVVLKLGHLGVVQQVEVDTNHFKGNFPESCVVYGTRFDGDDDEDKLLKDGAVKWEVLLPRVKLEAHKQHYFSVTDGNVNLIPGGVNYIKLEMFPDGGISRLRLLGHKKDAAARL